MRNVHSGRVADTVYGKKITRVHEDSGSIVPHLKDLFEIKLDHFQECLITA